MSEYWLPLGQPDLALKELEALPETVRQPPWPLRVQLAALGASNLARRMQLGTKTPQRAVQFPQCPISAQLVKDAEPSCIVHCIPPQLLPGLGCQPFLR